MRKSGAVGRTAEKNLLQEANTAKDDYQNQIDKERDGISSLAKNSIRQQVRNAVRMILLWME